MKTVFKILGAFAVIILTTVISDVVFGSVADVITQNKGLTKQSYIMAGQENYDVFFVGSSRAHRHYDTPFISDSLGLKSFNAGEDGRGLSYQYPLLSAYLNNRTPRLVVLEVSPEISGKWNERISMLYPLARKYNEITDVAQLIDRYNKYYLMSNLYRYNSNLTSEIRGIRNPFTIEKLGFDPLPVAKAPKGTFEDNSIRRYQSTIDTIECRILNDLISMCKSKNVTLVGIISPIYGKIERNNTVDSIFMSNGIMLIDNSSYRLPLEPNDYFKDATHLNVRGAREYTKYVMHQLCDSLQLID